MRTTIRIDDRLYRRAKAAAARAGRTVGDFIADAVRDALDRPAARGDLRDLPTFGGSGVQPGVDLHDAAALRALMDEGEPLDALR